MTEPTDAEWKMAAEICDIIEGKGPAMTYRFIAEMLAVHRAPYEALANELEAMAAREFAQPVPSVIQTATGNAFTSAADRIRQESR